MKHKTRKFAHYNVIKMRAPILRFIKSPIVIQALNRTLTVLVNYDAPWYTLLFRLRISEELSLIDDHVLFVVGPDDGEAADRGSQVVQQR